jgi:hypothetical protein
VRSPSFEAQLGARDEVMDGAGDEYLVRRRQRGDARPGMHSDPANVACRQFALARVHPRSDLEPQISHRRGDGGGRQ